MSARRKLVEGVRPDPTTEKEFVHSGKPKPTEPGQPPAEAAAPRETKRNSANAVSRAPLTTRIRSDFGAALKRASLERQLNGTTPYTLQDILEEALEPWLRKNGYLQ
jgi:hypothetical protein